MSTIILQPGKANLALLERAFREPRTDIEIDPAAKPFVDAAASIVATAAQGDQPVYGINTGFGKLAHIRIATEDTATLQRNLILSHCCGVGAPAKDAVVRLMMLLKALSLGRGASGVRWSIIELIIAMLNRDVLPIVPVQGSVGASGDLAPLAHLAAVMQGDGEARYQNHTLPGGEALRRVGLEPLKLGPKEGLALINGTQFSTALALAALFETRRLLGSALVTGALSTDAMMASAAPFRPEIHALRSHPGQIAVAATLSALMQGSEIRESHRHDDTRVQDPYCLRCQPQVMGACMDLVQTAGSTLEREANAVTDNPLVFSDHSIVSGGNFHAEPVAFAADQLALAIAETGAIAQRRIAVLVDPALNFGLPAFLAPEPGLNSGFMIAEVTSAALMAENKQMAAPCSVDSTPTSANQEDHVSMATHAAARLLRMNENLAHIVAIEWLAAAQGVELRGPLKTSEPLSKAVEALRGHVTRLDRDRYLAGDIEIAATLASAGTLEQSAGEYRLDWRS